MEAGLGGNERDNEGSMSDETGWKGIFAVLQTPLTASGELDERSMEKQVGFCAEQVF